MVFEKEMELQRQTILVSISFMIMMLAGMAAFYPLFTTGGEVHIEYLIFGAIAAFILFLLGQKLRQIKCPDCRKNIPANANLCPYCGRKFEKYL